MNHYEIQPAPSLYDRGRPGVVAERDLLDHLGIRRIPVDEFHYGGYRYSSARDAIAEAQRHPRQGHE